MLRPMLRPMFRRRSFLLPVVLACDTALAGCQKSGAVQVEVLAAPEDAPELLPAIEIPAAVPADVAVVGVLRSERGVMDWYARARLVGHVEPEKVEAFQRDLDAYLGRTVGVTFTDVWGGVFWVGAAGKTGGVVLRGVGGELAGRTVGEVAGTKVVEFTGEKVFGAVLGDALVVGNQASVEAAARSHAGEAPSLAKSDSRLKTLLTEGSEGAYVSIAAIVPDFPDDLWEEARTAGIEEVGMTLGPDGLGATARGEPEAMAALAEKFRSRLSVAKATVQAKRAAAVAGDDVAEGVTAIAAYHGMVQLESQLVPKVEGRHFRLRVPIGQPNSSAVVAMMGIGAAIAIPALSKYMRRSKTAEAKTNLARMFDAFSAYYQRKKRCPKRGDNQVGITPPLALNCNDGPGGRCVPTATASAPAEYDAAAWTEDPVWSGIEFAVEEAHYFHYAIKWNQGKGSCQFTAQAFGDLDDDGVFSTFERAARADKEGTTAAAGLYIGHEVE